MKKSLLMLPLIALLASCGGKGGSGNELLPDGWNGVTEEKEKQEVVKICSDGITNVISSSIIKFDGDASCKLDLALGEGESKQTFKAEASFKYSVAFEFGSVFSSLFNPNAVVSLPSVGLKIEDMSLKYEHKSEKGLVATNFNSLTFGAYLNGTSSKAYIDLSDETVNYCFSNVITLLADLFPEAPLPTKDKTVEEVFGTNKLLINLGDFLAGGESFEASKFLLERLNAPIVSESSIPTIEEILKLLGVSAYKYDDGRRAVTFEANKDTINPILEKFGVETLPEGYDLAVKSGIVVKEFNNVYKLNELTDSASLKANDDGFAIDASESSHLVIDYPSSISYFGSFVSGSASDYKTPTYVPSAL